YRIVDALLLRPLPIAAPDSFHYIANTYVDREGRTDVRDDFDYPTFRRYRNLAANVAELMVVGTNNTRAMIQIGAEPERVRRQFLSGNVFAAFGLHPAAGRLLMPDDDRVPGGHPVAVISYDFWRRRFNGDPAVVGKQVRI